METDSWDKILVEKSEEYLKDKPDRILYGIPDDDTHSRIKGSVETYGSCFPFLSFETVQCQGGIMPAEISSHCADTKLYEIFKKLSVPRILDLQKEIHLMHFCKHNGSREEDKTQKRVVESGKRCSALTPEQYQYYVDLLNARIEQYAAKTDAN